MASVHFTTMPREPYTAHSVQGKLRYCNICPCVKDIVNAWFEDVKTYERCLSFRSLIIMGKCSKCTSGHIFSYGELSSSSFV